MTTHTLPLALHAANRGGLVARLLARVTEADRRYREAVHLRGLSEDRLADIGLTRAKIERLGR